MEGQLNLALGGMVLRKNADGQWVAGYLVADADGNIVWKEGSPDAS